MAGCGTCPDQCGCIIVNDDGEQYPGIGTEENPIVIPEALDAPWVGTSSDGSITITPGDVTDEADGHAPDLVVNFCDVLNDTDLSTGDLLVVSDDDEDCRPHRLRDPLEGEVIARDPVTGKAGWVSGVASFGGDMPYAVGLEFYGDEGAVPNGYTLLDGGFLPIADNPITFGIVGHYWNGGVDPGDGTFRKPDRRGTTAAGLDNMGGTSANVVTDPAADTLGGVTGVEAAALVEANLPAHTHPLAINGAATGVTVNGGTTGISINGAGTGISIVGVSDHAHPGGAAGRSFVMVNNAGIEQVHFERAGHVSQPNDNLRAVVGNGDDPTHNKSQLNNANTGGAGSHSHSVSDPTHSHAIADGGHGHSISDPTHTHTGTATANAAHVAAPVSKMQPTMFLNYIWRLG